MRCARLIGWDDGGKARVVDSNGAWQSRVDPLNSTSENTTVIIGSGHRFNHLAKLIFPLERSLFSVVSTHVTIFVSRYYVTKQTAL